MRRRITYETEITHVSECKLRQKSGNNHGGWKCKLPGDNYGASCVRIEDCPGEVVETPLEKAKGLLQYEINFLEADKVSPAVLVRLVAIRDELNKIKE